jgi:CDP-diacylglycerol--serine O-phosphatidyltransferase
LSTRLLTLEKLYYPDLITLINGFVGFLAIMYIVDGTLTYAPALILVCILLDGLDGALARYLHVDARIHGRYLDAIADMISFCFAPAIYLYAVYYEPLELTFRSGVNTLTVATAMCVAGFGVLRLTAYIERGYKLETFTGLSTPAVALMIVLLVNSPLGLDSYPYIVLPTILFISGLMVTKLNYPKFHGSLGLIAGGVILSLILSELIIVENYIDTFIYIVALLLTVTYIISGPWLIKYKAWGRKI